MRFAFLLVFCCAALAYDPPVDTAGPLTARILEPSIGSYGAGGMVQLTRPEMPMEIVVTLENSGDAPLAGAVRLQVIERWRVEPASRPFNLAARGRARVPFTVTTGRRTYNAHYPIHAFAEFEDQGRRLTAHPILIMEARLPNPSWAQLPVEWKPVPVPARGALGLWRLPIHRERASVANAALLAGTTGRGTFEATSPVQFSGRGFTINLGLRAPSLRERVEAAAVEYPLALPETRPLVLRAVARGKGATARVRAGSELLFERRIDGQQAIEADLGRIAGRQVDLWLEAMGTTPLEWIEPAIVAGRPPQPPAPPQPRLLGKAGAYEVRFTPGRRGVLDGTIAFVNGSKALRFHGFHVRVLGDALEDWRSAHELTGVEERSEAGRDRFVHHFRGWAGAFDLAAALWVEHGALRVSFALENAPPQRPWLASDIEEVKAGEWSDTATRIYAGPGNVIEEPRAFQLGFDGHRLATSFAGFDFPGVSMLQGVDSPPERLEVDPQTRSYTLNTPLSQTISFIPAASVWDAVKIWREIDGLKAAAGVPKLAGRFVFDLWGFFGGYAASARALQKAFRYGLTDAVVVWHNWQRWGYDYRLPDIFPPNPKAGTLEDFRALIETCRRHGVLFAPHDNYIDFYPDAEGFSYDNIAFNHDGTPRRAWFNRGREAQSYRALPVRVSPFLKRNLELIKENLAPTAYFIDVWSSMGPYDAWDRNGEFHDRRVTRAVWRESFEWIRRFLGDNAPQISEAGHDQLIGWLDGAQANILRVDAGAGGFTWNIQCRDAERIPWFDAAHHDRFVLHGAGYSDRYAGGLDSATHGIYSDDYVSTEVLTGHPGMVAAPLSPEVVRKYWLLHDLMRSLALRRIDGFDFAGLHRQHVRWDNGAEVWVNRGGEDWNIAGHVLPQYGFYARAGGAEAAVERLNGALVEWARSPAMLYVNARGKEAQVGAVATDGAFRLALERGELVLTPLPAARKFSARLNWSGLPWILREPVEAEKLDEGGNTVGHVPLVRRGGEVLVDCEPGVFAYRLR